MRAIFLSFLSLGVFLLMQVALPFISFQLWELMAYQNNLILKSPQEKGQQVLGISVEDKEDFPAFFSSLKRGSPTPYSTFTLTVPSLGINSEVNVDENDLRYGLVHLPGSALPGEKGNVFISGHSLLPQLKGGKQGVFAKLPDVKKGDDVILSVGGTVFRYQVLGIKLVDPAEVSVALPPDEEGRYVSLMTCVPPGFNTKRLVVLGKLR